MKKHARAIFLCAAALVLAVLAWLFPGSREIDVTVPAAEYRLDDPGYVVEHTVTLRGRDDRNRLGHGTFQGTISVSGLEGLEEEHDFGISMGHDRETGFAENLAHFWPHGDWLHQMVPNWDYTAFVVLLENEDDGTPAHTFGGPSARLLISGPADREAAFSMARKLTRGTRLASYFEEN